jgi:hypothetical protein
MTKADRLIHVQGRLNSKLVREDLAIEAYDFIKTKSPDSTADREIVREALIAYAEKIEGGFINPGEMLVGEGKVTAEMLGIQRQILSVVLQLVNMDFSTVKNRDGSTFDSTSFQANLTTLQKSATSMLGEADWDDD